MKTKTIKMFSKDEVIGALYRKFDELPAAFRFGKLVVFVTPEGDVDYVGVESEQQD